MLWLAPPVLLTLGLGAGRPVGSGEPEPLVIAGIGYPVSDGDANVGLRLRGSHVSFYDLSRGERDGYQVDRIDRFELYTLDVCAYAEAEAGRWLVMALWAGAHLSAGEGSFDEVRIVPATGMTAGADRETETVVSGPAIAGGVLVGLNAYRSRRYRVMAFLEIQTSATLFLTARAREPTYRWTPVSFGVAVRF